MSLHELVNLMGIATGETLIMTAVASGFAILFGLGLGIVLYITKPQGLKEHKGIYRILDFVINTLRSVPFLILLIFIMPLTRLLIQTSIGLWATTIPLIVASIPFVSRLVEACLNQVDHNLLEMAKSLGSTTRQIIWHVVLPEAFPSLIENFSIASITILGYGAMAGFVGGGGLGTVAINYGHYRKNYQIMTISIILIIVIVQVLQWSGNKLVDKINKSK